MSFEAILHGILSQAGKNPDLVKVKSRNAGEGDLDLKKVLTTLQAQPGRWGGPQLLTKPDANGNTVNRFILGESTLGNGDLMGGPFTPRSLSTDMQLDLESQGIHGVADAADVATWPDSSLEENDGVQATASEAPHYDLDQGDGNPAVEFDGTDDSIEIPDLTFDPASDTFCMWALVWQPTPHDAAILAQDAGGGTGREFIKCFADGRFGSELGGVTNKTDSAHPAGTWHALLWEWDGTTLTFNVDNQADGTATPTPESAGGQWRVGTDNAGLNPLAGWVRCVGIVSPAPPAEYVTLLKQWLEDQKVSSAVKEPSMWVPVGIEDFSENETPAAAKGTFTGTNAKVPVYAFDDTTEEYVTLVQVLPDDLDTAGNVTFRFAHQAATAAASRNVEWRVGLTALDDDEDSDVTYTNHDSGDIAMPDTQDHVGIAGFSVSVSTLGAAAGNLVQMRVSRIAPSADNLVGDLLLRAFAINWPRTSE